MRPHSLTPVGGAGSWKRLESDGRAEPPGWCLSDAVMPGSMPGDSPDLAGRLVSSSMRYL